MLVAMQLHINRACNLCGTPATTVYQAPMRNTVGLSFTTKQRCSHSVTHINSEENPTSAWE
jgi:hypothetical protein